MLKQNLANSKVDYRLINLSLTIYKYIFLFFLFPSKMNKYGSVYKTNLCISKAKKKKFLQFKFTKDIHFLTALIKKKKNKKNDGRIHSVYFTG